ncbi:primase-helicase zinc-binding domain-containing protein [Methylomonas sp. AM2-LC]|uniref:DUF7146 domain-containing protein n=1 Tax=Methylomonas sp. AM2-LC TaxID=3153301 RepID=UPI00326579E7
MTAYFQSDLVKSEARGSWLYILGSLAPEIDGAINNPGRKHIPCPIHGGKDGFRLFRDADISGGGICNTCGAKNDGFNLLMWLKGWAFPDAISAVAGTLGISEDKGYKPPNAVKKTIEPVVDRSKDPWIKQLLRDTWDKSLPITHPDAEPLRLYLRSRGLDDELPNTYNLRFHPSVHYKDEDGIFRGYFPAMLALLQDAKGRKVTIHRTYLMENGQKFPFKPSKRMMPVATDRNIIGSAVKLGTPCRILSVAEGIENALAVTEATGMYVWPLLSTSYMPGFSIPDGVEKLLIWADLDRNNAGLIAAEKLAENALKQNVEPLILMPPGTLTDQVTNIDWCDVLVSDGQNAFDIRGNL